VGQQQLLLLVLSTVIVDLAVVAGIEAFDQGQRQATQDALTQRAVSIGTDIVAAHEKPSQPGGIDLDENDIDDQPAEAAGLDPLGSGGSGISAEGAGSSATCTVDNNDGVAFVDCGSESNSRFGRIDPKGLIVKVRVDPKAEEKVKVVEVGENIDTANQHRFFQPIRCSQPRSSYWPSGAHVQLKRWAICRLPRNPISPMPC